MKERVQKIIAERGVCSRRAAEKLIEEGRVRVNGRKVDGTTFSLSQGRTEVVVTLPANGPQHRLGASKKP